MVGRLWKLLAAVAVAALLVATMGACGGGSSGTSSASATDSSGSGSGEVLARVGSTPITKAQLTHWMGTLAGGDYYELSAKHTVPANLVSDPPNYGACVASLEAAAAAAPVKLAQPTGVQLLTKCRQLYQAIRAQAMALLVEIQWVLGLGSDEGITVSDAEALAFYNKSMAERFPKRAELSRYQADRRTSASDELLLIKKNLVSEKLLAKVKSQGSAGTAGFIRAQASETAKTDCHPGYVVEYCMQFHGEASGSVASPPASVLVEQVAALATGRCINRPACAKQ